MAKTRTCPDCNGLGQWRVGGGENVATGLCRTCYGEGEIEDRPCYHPLSCSSCNSLGKPCGQHRVGDVGHDRCKGRSN